MHLASAELAQALTAKLSREVLGDFVPQKHTADQMIAALDGAGIQKALALSNAYQCGSDFLGLNPEEVAMVRFENDFAAREAAKYPERLVPFLSIHPLKDYAVRELERCVNDLGMRGLKLHFTNSNVDLHNPDHLIRIQNLLAHAAKINLPVLIHFLSRSPSFGGGDVEILLEQVIAGLPNLKVQIAHLGCGAKVQTTIEVFEAFIRGFEKNPALNKERMFIDIAAVIIDSTKPPLEALTREQELQITDQIRRWGVEHTLWATDWPFYEPLDYIQAVNEKLHLGKSEFEILYGNKGFIG
jgi:uncharacterized protein